MIPYPKRFRHRSNIQVFFALGNFSIDYPQNYINFYGLLGNKDETGLTFNVFSNMTSHIKKLTYRYLIISGEYASVQANNTNLLMFEAVFTITPGTITYPYTLNTTGGITLFYSITGFNVSSSSSPSLCFRFDIYGHSSTQVSFSWSGRRSSNIMTSGLVYVNIMLFNTDFFNKENFAKFTFWQSQYYSGFRAGVTIGSTPFEIT